MHNGNIICGDESVRLSPAECEVLAECRRQIVDEGYGPDHDDRHAGGELHRAARCYLYACDDRERGIRETTIARNDPNDWPWHPTHWKPRDQRRDLVRAVALLMAELRRLDRIEARRAGGPAAGACDGAGTCR